MAQRQATTTKKRKTETNQQAGVNQTLWTVMIHLAADNNLAEECVFSLTEMQKAGSAAKVDVLAQFDSGPELLRYDFRKLRTGGKPVASPGQGNGNGAGSAALNGKLEGLAERILAQTILAQPGVSEQSNGHRRRPHRTDSRIIKDFFNHVIRQEKAGQDPTLGLAKPYHMAILSGHGSGAVGDFLNSDHPPSAMTIPELKTQVIDPVTQELEAKLDILGMDSCLMSMAEVCYELRNDVRYMVGAEGLERNTGWPYQEILKALYTTPTIEPKEVAGRIVKEYIHYYSDYTVAGISVDHAACDLSYSDILRDAVMGLAQVLQDKLSQPAVEDAILLAHWRAQSYKFEQYVDLWDFCDLLENGCGDPDVKAACGEVKDTVEKFVLISCYSGAAFQHSHGLSIYFPWAKTDLDRDLSGYRKLAFHQDTKWGDFLEAYGKQTQREVRGNSRKPRCKSGKRELLEMPPRDDTGTTVRVNPAADDKGEHLKVAQVKNPPDQFYKYEDDCAGECGK